MNALGCREAKINLAVAGASGMQTGNRCGDDFSGFTRALAWRQQFGESLFNGHIGSQ